MKLFIDECLSPALARHLNQSGTHDVLHPRDYGRLGERDDEVLARCLAEDRMISPRMPPTSASWWLGKISILA
ncbi:DUF5615 family PIN-like protein [Sphingomonas oligophenolica]|uniref:DUF5615 family PIN-like protein n=1 Tax=Sphingomonas oligophenolica TaxID=301154 RepID=UPI003CD0A820